MSVLCNSTYLMIAPVCIQETGNGVTESPSYRPVVGTSGPLYPSNSSKQPAMYPRDYKFLSHISRRTTGSNDNEGIVISYRF